MEQIVESQKAKLTINPKLRTGIFYVDGPKFNSKVRAYFDKYKEGQTLRTGAKSPSGYQVRYTLTYKREDLKKVKQEYDVTVMMTVRRPDGKVFKHPIHILAQPGKVFFDSPKRGRK